MNEKQEITIRAGEADDIVNTFCDCVNRSAVVSSAEESLLLLQFVLYDENLMRCCTTRVVRYY